jgi:sugar phosphate isomerase/epimerase
MDKSASVYIGVNLNFTKFVYSHKRALEVARDDIGAHYVEMVPDTDYGPAFFLDAPERFRDYHLEVGQHAKDLGVGIPTLLTFYRDNNSISHSDPEIRKHAYTVMRSMAVQGGCLGCKVVGASFGSVLAEDMDEKFDECVNAGIEYWKQWLVELYDEGVECATLETMSTLREPPATIKYAAELIEPLMQYHADHSSTTARPAYCYDVGHAAADEEIESEDDKDLAAWFKAFPKDIVHLHIKNTDSQFLATWPFTDEYRDSGIIDLHKLARSVRDDLDVKELYVMVEMPGKRGRLIGEKETLDANRKSLENLKLAFRDEGFSENASDHTWSLAGE